jgi:phosphate transport system protein
VSETTRTHFQEELSKLEEQALGGLDMVVSALDRAMETVQHQDVELASMVISDDDRIDGRYLEVHQGVLSLLALQAPLAGHNPPSDERVLSHIQRMGEQARQQVIQCKQAFARRNVELAQDLVRQDDEIDRLNREVFTIALEIGDDPDTREWAMHMMLVARCIERIGDNAVDIGEQTAFIVTGLFREFEDASHPELSPP